MKKKLVVFVILSAFVIATVPGVLAAVIVHDPKNTAENHATYLQAAQNTLNTSTQIANQVLDLTSISSEAMLAYILGIEEEFASISDTIKQAQGLMKASQTAQKAWDSAFKQIDTFFQGETTQVDNLADSQKMIYALDRTYQDSLRVAKAADDIEKDAKRLRELMKQNQNAVGNKQAIQTQNNLVAQQNKLTIEQNQTIAALTTAVVAHYSRQNQIQAQALAVNQKYIDEIDKDIQRILENEKNFTNN